MRRSLRAGALAVPVVVLLGVPGLSGCAREEQAPASSSVGVTTVTTESREGVDAAIKVCRQLITSAGVMVRDYNAFITALNDTQDYARIDNEDRYAQETLNNGADLIRQALTPAVPRDLDEKVQRFLTATEQLSEQVGKRRKLALNKAMDDWSASRDEVVDACGEFMPTGAN